jgi:hypothetical protein
MKTRSLRKTITWNRSAARFWAALYLVAAVTWAVLAVVNREPWYAAPAVAFTLIAGLQAREAAWCTRTLRIYDSSPVAAYLAEIENAFRGD